MPNVITEIKQWAKSLPYWEQATLDKILSGNLLTNTDYDELGDYLLSDSGLSSATKPHIKLIHLAAVDPSVENTSTSIILNRIFNLQNINALIHGQELSFCPNLTAIYGETGAGKSGYARVLGCAGFTRGDKLVLPDIAKPWDSDMIRSADIEILENNSPKVIKYIVGESCNELSQCYVFDSTSVHMHLTGTNSFSFSPAGLTILTQLSDETDKVRQLLQNKIEDHRKPHNFMLLFQGKTEVTDFIQTIGLKTNLEELLKLSTYSTTEANRTSQLDLEIAALKTLAGC